MGLRSQLAGFVLGPRCPALVRRWGLRALLSHRARPHGIRCRLDQTGNVHLTRAGEPAHIVRLAPAHAPYALNVIDRFDYYFETGEPVVEGGALVLDCRTPRLHRVRPSGAQMFFTGLPEPEDTTASYLALANLRPGDLVLDLGAYCGGSTIAFARAVTPGGFVVALEPDPGNAAALRQNLSRHGVTNAHVEEAGVWRDSTQLMFAGEGNTGSAISELLPRPAPARHVRVLSLPDVVALACRVSGLARVAFIKMDVEGAEVAALEQARILREHSTRLVVEPHWTPPPRRLTDADVIARLTAIGYHCVPHEDAGGLLLVATPPA